LKGSVSVQHTTEASTFVSARPSSDGRSGLGFVAERASHELRKAEKLTRREATDFTDAQFDRIEAVQAREDGERLLTLLPAPLVGTPETELVPALEPKGYPPSVARLSYTNTLMEPNVISVDASEHRAMLATRLGSFSMGLDAAATAGATNSIEKMLAHQMAAVHQVGMGLLERAEHPIDGLPPAERVRYVNAAVRCFECFQNGAVALQKLQNGGAQRVVVQHVNVEPGGRAVVANEVVRKCQ
jgi:hypothetical protein